MNLWWRLTYWTSTKNDFKRLKKLVRIFEITFNVMKCYQLRIGAETSSQTYFYPLNGKEVWHVSKYPYLGVEKGANLNLESQVRTVTAKANRSLRFINEVYIRALQIKYTMCYLLYIGTSLVCSMMRSCGTPFE